MLTDYANTTLLQGPRQNNGSGKKVMPGTESTSNELGDEDLELPFFSFRDIVSATNNFSEGNMLGRGGFRKVYKVTTMKFLHKCRTKLSTFPE